MKPLVNTLESDKSVAVVCSMWYHIGQKLIGKVGEKLNVSPICTGKSETNKNDNRTLLPTACSCLLRKGLFNPPFDNDYFIYQDDVYLGWMAWLRGYKALINYESKLWHIGAATVGFFNYRQVYLNERNRFMTILIFLKAKSMLLLMPIFIVDFVFRLFYLLLSRKFELAKAEFAAIWYNIANAKRIFKKRKRVWKTRKVCDYEILNIMCEDVYGKGGIKSILNVLLKIYFRFVKKVCKIFKI